MNGLITARMANGLVAEVWQTCTLSYPNSEGMADQKFEGQARIWWVTAWALTPREVMVAELAMQGWSDKQIAEQLCLAIASISKYMSRILRKSQARSRAELAERAGVVSVG